MTPCQDQTEKEGRPMFVALLPFLCVHSGEGTTLMESASTGRCILQHAECCPVEARSTSIHGIGLMNFRRLRIGWTGRPDPERGSKTDPGIDRKRMSHLDQRPQNRPRMRRNTPFGGRSWTTLSRCGLTLLILFLFIASSRLPVGASTHRFGTERSKRTRICPSEQAGAAVGVKTGQRTSGRTLSREFVRSLPKSPESCVQPLSPESACRLALGDRRPEYLKFFAPSSSPTFLPPPSA